MEQPRTSTTVRETSIRVCKNQSLGVEKRTVTENGWFPLLKSRSHHLSSGIDDLYRASPIRVVGTWEPASMKGSPVREERSPSTRVSSFTVEGPSMNPYHWWSTSRGSSTRSRSTGVGRTWRGDWGNDGHTKEVRQCDGGWVVTSCVDDPSGFRIVVTDDRWDETARDLLQDSQWYFTEETSLYFLEKTSDPTVSYFFFSFPM